MALLLSVSVTSVAYVAHRRLCIFSSHEPLDGKERDVCHGLLQLHRHPLLCVSIASCRSDNSVWAECADSPHRRSSEGLLQQGRVQTGCVDCPVLVKPDAQPFVAVKFDNGLYRLLYY